ncbi:glycosyltransferase family 2 protein [Brevundimonas sp.]|uniref:glycosyltransferase family 2 protein n=1 Tax=Brevundimonas sp. TaxID=1871086 RepID=UPI0028AB9368|nr:glycosyltransferase family 2 protein [Brevundimonas sp.]
MIASERHGLSSVGIERFRFREGAVRGELRFNGVNVGRECAVKVDEVEVAIVKVRGRDPAGGPFTWFVPPRYYDGARHTIAIEAIDHAHERHVISSASLTRTFQREDAPQLNAHAALSRKGEVVGWAWNSAMPEDVLQIEVWEDGQLIDLIQTGEQPPAYAPEACPASSGFRYRPKSLAKWIAGKGQLVERKFSEEILVDISNSREFVRIDFMEEGEGLQILLRCPIRLSLPSLSAEIDGVDAEVAVEYFTNFVRIRLNTPDAADSSEHQIRIRLSDGGVDIVNEVETFRWRAPQGLLLNSALSDWSGATPLSWEVGKKFNIFPGYEPGPGGTSFCYATFGWSGGEETKGWHPVIGQEFEVSESGTAELAFEVSARANSPTALRLSVSDVSGLVAEVELNVGDEWCVHRGRLELMRGVSGRVKVVVQMVPRKDIHLELATVDVGPMGFRVRTDRRHTPNVGVELAKNGDFKAWSRGVVFTPTEAVTQIADYWTVLLPSDHGEIGAALSELDVRGERKYALALWGRGGARPVRLANELSNIALYGDVPIRFKIEVRRRTPRHQLGCSSARISRVYLADSIKTAGVEATLARDVLLTDTSQEHVFSLNGEDSPWGRNLDGDVPVCSAFLVLEFNCDPIDLIISELRVETIAPEQLVPLNYNGFEDFNVVSQAEIIERNNKASTSEGSKMGVALNGVPVWKRSTYPLVDVVITVHNAEVEVEQCINAIISSTDIPYRLIVVDDDSNISTRNMLVRLCGGRPWVELIHNGDNLGYTRSANKAMKRGGAPWIVLLNSDTVVTNGWLQGLLAVAETDDRVAMVGPLSNAATWQSVPKVRDRNGKWAVNAIPTGMTLEEWAAVVRQTSEHSYPEVPVLNGFCTLIKREALERVGYLDEETFPVGYGEEVDLCVRLTKAGYKLRVADDVYVYHHKSSSFGHSGRAVLAKAGGAAFRKKHDDVNFEALEQGLAYASPLGTIRARLAQLENSK